MLKAYRKQSDLTLQKSVYAGSSTQLFKPKLRWSFDASSVCDERDGRHIYS